ERFDRLLLVDEVAGAVEHPVGGEVAHRCTVRVRRTHDAAGHADVCVEARPTIPVETEEVVVDREVQDVRGVVLGKSPGEVLLVPEVSEPPGPGEVRARVPADSAEHLRAVLGEDGGNVSADEAGPTGEEHPTHGPVSRSR